jgi:hypothetical protein
VIVNHRGESPAPHVAEALVLRFEIALMCGSCKNSFPVNGLYFQLYESNPSG